MDGLVQILRASSKKYGRPIVLLSDEPYRRLVYDGVTPVPLFPRYEHTIIVSSFSKELGLAGERIGYLAMHPEFSEADRVLAESFSSADDGLRQCAGAHATRDRRRARRFRGR
ncbi:MAG: aminotransferase class I/II-fold pyridoxal phosphate-dependent enzyme [Planctomycetota bacterium]